MDFLGYLGVRGRRRVFGLWNETEVRFFVLAWELVPWRAAFLAALALAFLAAEEGAAALAFELFVAAIANGGGRRGRRRRREGKSGRLIRPSFVYRDSKLRFELSSRPSPDRAVLFRVTVRRQRLFLERPAEREERKRNRGAMAQVRSCSLPTTTCGTFRQRRYSSETRVHIC